MSYQQTANFVNRPKPQLEKERKAHLMNFYDALSLKKNNVHNSLKVECNLSFKKLTTQPATTKFADQLTWVLKWSITDMNCLENCIFVNESGFSINMRLSDGWSLKGIPAVVSIPSTRAVAHTILGAISDKSVVSMEL
ncbi:hypothetical protein G6F37_006444 [Rhizopus arrhizus]|nr:hypothetical protein G6F38_006497 [Rhizopus arrhizus]KAG1157725.1 hypothetical protein G6F37_006444 [Rhizopus arrhizus]